MRYAPTAGYVRSFEIPMQFSNWVRAALQKTVPFLSSLSPRCGAYAIRPYNRVRVILQNTDAIPQPSTYEGSKNRSVYATVGGVWWGVFDTPLRPNTCDPSKYRCNFPTGYMRFFEIPMRFSNRVRMRVQKMDLYSFSSSPRCEAYSIRPYDWVRVILRNTDVIPRPGMCDSSKYRCDSPTGYVRSFEIPMRSLEWRGRGVWEVGRWGLPFAGEVGVNEFGEEEDDDQDYNNEGARGDLQHEREP